MDVSASARVAAIQPWFHSIDLGNGLITPGQAPIHTFKAAADVYFSFGVEGKTVLDVGAWDGFFSFEAEKRGASRVLAADWYCWGGPGPGNPEAFRAARKILGSKVEDLVIDISDLTVDKVGQFDIVLFNGIIYHIFDPIHGLAAMSKIARDILVVETYVDNLENPRAVMNFYPFDNNPPGLPQNGWGANPRLMHALFKALGFKTVVEFPTPGLELTRRIFIAFNNTEKYSNYISKHIYKTTPTPIIPRAPGSIQETTLPPILGWRAIMRAIFTRLTAYF